MNEIKNLPIYQFNFQKQKIECIKQKLQNIIFQKEIPKTFYILNLM